MKLCDDRAIPSTSFEEEGPTVPDTYAHDSTLKLSSQNYDEFAHNDTKNIRPQEAKWTDSSEKILQFEQIFDSIRHYGRYQLFMLFAIQYIMLNSVGNYIFMSFAILRPQCQQQQILIVQDICAEIAQCPANSSVSTFHSLYEEPNFVCPESHLPHHMQTLQAIGSGIGAMLGGHFADYFGRKWVTFIGGTFMCFFGMFGGFSMDWKLLAISMFGMGLSYGILVDASMTLASETVGPRYRIVQTLAFQWSFVIQIAALIAYLTADWRRYLLTINGICIPALALMLFWRESPRWLIQKRRHAEACRELSAISAFNGCTRRFRVEDLVHIQLNANKRDSCKVYYVWDLFATRKLAAYSMVMFFSALSIEMIVAIIIFDVQILAGNPFLNIALYGMLRIWVPFFIVMMEARSSWFGRRILFLFSQATTVICYSIIILMLLLMPQRHSRNSNGTNGVLSDSDTVGSDEARLQLFDVLRTVLSLIGGVIHSGIFFTIYKQYIIELYPTLMRAMAVGAFGVVERIGGGLTPQLIAMNSWTWPGTALTITTAIALLSLISGYVILPETRNCAMPDLVRQDGMATTAADEEAGESAKKTAQFGD